ncbi:MAG: transposase [Leptolyngbyaceae cyanobacterium SL_1_1]|nr:transposase [Leptolyngbyaceae cyanobacterium RM1_1_2]NJO09240.1 transposase [Leptolyngbyaceae cyanobacterium SL_1_1]
MNEDAVEQLPVVSAVSTPPELTGCPYLVTLCTYQKESLFGDLSHETPDLNEIGRIAADEWVRSSARHREIQLDRWALRPDRIEGIVIVNSEAALREASRDRHTALTKPRSLSSFVAGFKAAAAKRINLLRNQPGVPVWERSYQEQRVPDSFTLNRLRQKMEKDSCGLV